MLLMGKFRLRRYNVFFGEHSENFITHSSVQCIFRHPPDQRSQSSCCVCAVKYKKVFKIFYVIVIFCMMHF